MEKAPLTRRQQPAAAPLSRTPSPRLLRSKSGTPAITLSESHSISSSLLSSSHRFVSRSKSTTKWRSGQTNNEKENTKKPQHHESSRDGFVRFLQRDNSNITSTPRNSSAKTSIRKPKSVTSSPSAWALSPGRISPSWIATEPPAICITVEKKAKSSSSSRSGVSGVLNYFRQNKVSPIQEEEYHQFRVLHNRQLQWRFANARAEFAMGAVQMAAEEKLFCVWIWIFAMRNSIVEKRIQVQKLKREIKLRYIVGLHIDLLNDWAKLEAKNYEAVSRVNRKLSVLSLRVPLIQGAKSNVASIYEAMSTAMAVLDSIEAVINKFSLEVERMLYLVTELVSMLEQQDECTEEVEKIIQLLPSLLACEGSLRAHLIQADKE